MNNRLLLASVCSIATILSGCPESSTDPDAFVQGDTGMPGDAGADAGRDGGGTADAGHDAGVDAFVPADAGSDAGNDAFVPVDAFVPTDAFDPTCGVTCDDGNPCNGIETCDTTSHACVPGTAPSCDDGMACTVDSCAPTSGCVHTEGDTDGDGALDCTDCAPSDPTRYSGAPETCNSRDDDCDGNIDETTVSLFYTDCDGDGFAPTGAGTVSGCSMPTDDPGCGTTAQTWTARAPSGTDYDCNDDEANAHSHALTFRTMAMSVSPDTGLDYDYDCDSAETRESTVVGSCVMAGSACTTTMGWMGTVPACGSGGTFITACGAGCTPTTMSRTQGCR